jgi:hypothetical protein
LLPGGFGTMDEAFELLTLIQTGKAPIAPVVLLDVPGGSYWQTWKDFVDRELGARGYIDDDDLGIVRITDDTEVALDELTGFYTNYHSQRYVDGDLVLRLEREPDDALLARLNREFADMVLGERGIERVGASRAEQRDGDHVDLPRLRMRFDRRSYSRLRRLVDTLNGRA